METHSSTPASGVTQQPPAEAFSDKPEIKAFPDRNEPTLALCLLDLGLVLRHNTRSHRTEISQLDNETLPGSPVKQWVQINGRIVSRMRDLMTRRFTYQTTRETKPLDFGRDRWAIVLNAHLCSREVDPFLEWLDERPEWDKRERLDGYLDELFGAGRSQLVQWAGAFLFCGCVKRAYSPGAMLAEMPVLVGAQGIGKSALLRNLFPPEYADDWTTDGLHLAADPKVRAEALQGRVVVEAGEMAGANRADLESLKSFISRQDDGGIRLAWRSDPEPSPRRCIIVGTTNRTDVLPNDPSGNRRFVPVLLNPATRAVEDYMAFHRDMLWAEALARHADGYNPALPRTLHKVAGTVAETHRNRDAMLEDALDALPPDYTGTLAEIAERVKLSGAGGNGVQISQRDIRRLSAALTNRGRVVRQVKEGGIKRRIWQQAVPVPAGTA